MKKAIVVFIRRRGDIRLLIPAATVLATALKREVHLFAHPNGDAKRIKEQMSSDMVDDGFGSMVEKLTIIDDKSVREVMASRGLEVEIWLGAGVEHLDPKKDEGPEVIKHMIFERKCCAGCGKCLSDEDREVSVETFIDEVNKAKEEEKEWYVNGPTLTIVDSSEKCRLC